MTIIFTAAGIVIMIVGLLFLVSASAGEGGALAVVRNKVKLSDAVVNIIGGALLVLGVVVLVLQIWAAVGQGSQSGDPYLLNWVSNLFKKLTSGELPQLK